MSIVIVLSFIIFQLESRAIWDEPKDEIPAKGSCYVEKRIPALEDQLLEKSRPFLDGSFLAAIGYNQQEMNRYDVDVLLKRVTIEEKQYTTAL